VPEGNGRDKLTGYRAGRVLLVEDDDDTRLALLEALAELGHEVDAQNSAEAALARLGSVDFDVVLSDIKMAGIDGIELCRRLTQDRPHVPVVVMTAFGDVDSALGALRAGAHDFIIKPFTITQVATALDRALDPVQRKPMMTRLAEVQQSVNAGGITDEGPARGDAWADAAPMQSSGASLRSVEVGPQTNLEEVERQHIVLVLKVFDWNKALAARRLGIDRATLYRKIKLYGLEPTPEGGTKSEAGSQDDS
jgi:DNA-binding NtrC family response regulator